MSEEQWPDDETASAQHDEAEGGEAMPEWEHAHSGQQETLHVFIVRERDLLLFDPDGLLMVESTLAAPARGANDALPQDGSASPEDRNEARRRRRRRRALVIGGLSGLITLLGALVLVISSLLASPPLTATVVLIPRTTPITVTLALAGVLRGDGDGSGSGPPTTTTQAQLPVHLLGPLAFSARVTVAASGHGAHPAQSARGTLTFYNGAFVAQSIPAGTTLVGKDGVVVITETGALVPAAQAGIPPVYGETRVPAQTELTGPAGNIAALDIDTTCCGASASVLAENLAAFTGGQAAHAFRVVTQADLDTATRQLAPALHASAQAAFAAQARPGEAVVTLAPCQSTVTSSAPADAEATQVTVTERLSCQAVAYPQATLQQLVTAALDQQAARVLGQPARMLGVARITVQAALLSKQGASVQLSAQSMGVYVPLFAPRQVQQWTTAIAGKTVRAATQLLARLPGIAQVRVTLSGSGAGRGGSSGGGDAATLPTDQSAIQLLVEVPPIPPQASLTPPPS